MKYNELPHVLAHNKKEAAKHKGETIASLRVELATLRAQNEKLREALRQINNSNNWWFEDGTYVWANKEDLHEWIEKRIEESK